MSQRLEELRANLSELKNQIQNAAEHAQAIQAVQLIAVSKTWPASDVRNLYELGQRHFGENRSQDAVVKAEELLDLDDIVWHHIGQIQTNKAAQIVSYADYVHSVDRLKAAQAISKAAVNQQKQINVLIQVSLDAEPTSERGGVASSELIPLAAEITALPNLKLVGLMAVAPLDEPAAATFAKFQRIANEFGHIYADATIRSIGMSGDFQEAIAAGATHLRIGSTLFGNRSYQ
jgi:PLP dependent protein